MSSTWDVGDARTLWVEWLDKEVDGVLTASVTTLTVIKPDGTTITPPVTSPSIGRYQASIKVDQPGTWGYRFESDDVLTIVEQKQFYVQPSLVPV